MKKQITGSTYDGSFLVNTLNPHWTSLDNFSLDVLEHILDDTAADEQGDDEYDGMALMPGRPMCTDKQYTEWKVFRNGQWMDSVYFRDNIDSASVRCSLVEHDNYPADIIVLAVAKG